MKEKILKALVFINFEKIYSCFMVLLRNHLQSYRILSNAFPQKLSAKINQDFREYPYIIGIPNTLKSAICLVVEADLKDF